MRERGRESIRKRDKSMSRLYVLEHHLAQKLEISKCILDLGLYIYKQLLRNNCTSINTLASVSICFTKKCHAGYSPTLVEIS